MEHREFLEQLVLMTVGASIIYRYLQAVRDAKVETLMKLPSIPPQISAVSKEEVAEEGYQPYSWRYDPEDDCNKHVQEYKKLEEEKAIKVETPSTSLSLSWERDLNNMIAVQNAALIPEFHKRHAIVERNASEVEAFKLRQEKENLEHENESLKRELRQRVERQHDIEEESRNLRLELRERAQQVWNLQEDRESKPAYSEKERINGLLTAYGAQQMSYKLCGETLSSMFWEYLGHTAKARRDKRFIQAGNTFLIAVEDAIEVMNNLEKYKPQYNKHARCVSGGTWMIEYHWETKKSKCKYCKAENEPIFEQMLEIIQNPYGYPHGEYKRQLAKLHAKVGIDV